MFGNKMNREKFKMNINKEQAEQEYREYFSQPSEVLENLRRCKIFMAVFIPIGILLTLAVLKFFFESNNFVGFIVALILCFLLGMIVFFLSKRTLKNIKLRVVPLICLFSGWLIYILCIQKIILIILNVAG